jgi:hypothetical protein
VIIRLFTAGIFAAALAWVWPAPAQAETNLPPQHVFTRDLPQPDHAEVVQTESPDGTGAAAASTAHDPRVSLKKQAAQHLAGLIRAQSWGESTRACALSQFKLLFYAQDKLVASESICFHCECLQPIASDIHPLMDKESFDSMSPKAVELRNYLDGLFTSKK